MGRAAILGTGLIGASLGMALRKAGWVIAGWDPDDSALAGAAKRGAVDHACPTRDAAIDDADLIVLAGPPSATIATLGQLHTDALVTDVAGVKEPVVRARPDGLRLVAGHPMAGREQAGPTAATPSLFRGAAWIVCPDGADDSDVESVKQVIDSVGAIPYTMSAAEHDRVVAAISHLPQLIAVSLVNLASSDPGAMELVAGSFRDLTRVAASEPGWWPELLAANLGNVSRVIDTMVYQLETARSEILTDRDSLASRFESARVQRRRMASHDVRVGVVLQDRPGEIAAVGRALEQSAVDVRDLQLRHAPHGGGGVLTISVRPQEAATLRDSLAVEGFTFE
ncbi:MAG: prephenate dehydrogenase/arogenate dehydrogenase family protein [bacterium]|nr:prephenate dehydrogenase/arogenate dehydrogenase family protein [bacterium]